ncbi:MAG: FapA family protein [Oscillospiraceae bacterium]
MTDSNYEQNQMDQCEENPQEEEIVPVDCELKVEIAPNGLDAKIIAYPPKNGGREISKEAVIEALNSAGVTYGIAESVVSILVKTKKYEAWIAVASHTPPVNGKDGKIEYLFEKNVSGELVEDARGFVDYKDLHIVRNITAGTVIGNIIPETQGEPGTTVLNTPIKQVLGVPPKPELGENVIVNEEKTQIVAKQNGNLVFSGGRFHVKTTLKMDGDIDASTGNIDFIGDIIIRGDIKEGFIVKSAKTITVYGSAYGSFLTAGEAIIIKNGAIGSSLIANGRIEIDFAENAKIRCSELLKANSLYFCDVYCRGEVNLTMRNGSIMGGRLVCTQTLTALNIGSRNYTPTHIVVGDNAILTEEKDRLEIRIKELNGDIEKCNKILEFLAMKKQQLGSLPPDKIEILNSAAKTITMAQSEVEQLTQRIDEIDVALQTKQNISVVCRKELNPGVKIVLNDTVFSVNTLYQHCEICLGDDGPEVRNL